MKKLVTAEIMRQLDKMVIEEHGIKSSTLMENAAQSVFDKIIEYENSVQSMSCSNFFTVRLFSFIFPTK